MSDVLKAPWTDEQIAALDVYQNSGEFHPYTCGNRGDGKHPDRPGRDRGQLTPSRDGWICADCDYTQDWAHAFSASDHFLPISAQVDLP